MNKKHNPNTNNKVFISKVTDVNGVFFYPIFTAYDGTEYCQLVRAYFGSQVDIQCLHVFDSMDLAVCETLYTRES